MMRAATKGHQRREASTLWSSFRGNLIRMIGAAVSVSAFGDFDFGLPTMVGGGGLHQTCGGKENAKRQKCPAASCRHGSIILRTAGLPTSIKTHRNRQIV